MRCKIPVAGLVLAGLAEGGMMRCEQGSVSVYKKENACAFSICSVGKSLDHVAARTPLSKSTVKDISNMLGQAFAVMAEGSVIGCPGGQWKSIQSEADEYSAGTGSEVPFGYLLKWRSEVLELHRALGLIPSECTVNIGSGAEQTTTFKAGGTSCGFDICTLRQLVVSEVQPGPDADQAYHGVLHQLDEALLNVQDGFACGGEEDPVLKRSLPEGSSYVLSLLPTHIVELDGTEVYKNTLLNWQQSLQEMLVGQGGESRKTLIERFRQLAAGYSSTKSKGTLGNIGRVFGTAAMTAIRIGEKMLKKVCQTAQKPNLCGIVFCKLAMQAAIGAIQHHGTPTAKLYAGVLSTIEPAASKYAWGCPEKDGNWFLQQINSHLRGIESNDETKVWYLGHLALSAKKLQ